MLSAEDLDVELEDKYPVPPSMQDSIPADKFSIRKLIVPVGTISASVGGAIFGAAIIVTVEYFTAGALTAWISSWFCATLLNIWNPIGWAMLAGGGIGLLVAGIGGYYICKNVYAMTEQQLAKQMRIVESQYGELNEKYENHQQQLACQQQQLANQRQLLAYQQKQIIDLQTKIGKQERTRKTNNKRKPEKAE